MSSDALVHFYKYLRKTCRKVGCVPCKQAKVSSRGQSTTVMQSRREALIIRLCQKVTPIPNRTMTRSSFSAGYRIIRCALQKYSLCVAKPFDPCCKTIRCVLPRHSIRVAKPFDLRCKTVQCKFPNHSILVAKPFDPCCKTIRSVLQNHSICVAKPFKCKFPNHSIRVSKPFDPRCQTI